MHENKSRKQRLLRIVASTPDYQSALGNEFRNTYSFLPGERGGDLRGKVILNKKNES